ncbi:Metallo-dependent hydrolase [Tothia fuscella]|uniref:N-acetylglucosamine-6-phosphate deacetylase n=1 Tax=Tothia fuscella TaxID=1048955 RepID=A0A9P4NPW5_9PEZI|nr:Metallo-dependent hydrolase [Tothia fuscella]
MPSAIRSHSQSPIRRFRTRITKFTNCRLLKNGSLVKEDLWIGADSGKILDGQDVFFHRQTAPDQVIDLGGRILSPGFIDVQLNGAFGFNFSIEPENSATYVKELTRIKKSLVETGVTSFLPTTTSQRPETYHKVLRFLGPSGAQRNANDGAESLGAHCEGPFINPCRNGIHSASVLRAPANGLEDLIACYGQDAFDQHTSPIKLVTLAPELPGSLATIAELKKRNIITSIGHSAATYEEAKDAVESGASMITHLFNAMSPLHHRNPGMFGLLGQASVPGSQKPFFGIIADGIHLHSSVVNIAWNAHPDGFILVTDAMPLVGMPDGVYDWTNGDRLVKNGHILTLEGSDKLAGSSITLIECVNNFLKWSGTSFAQALGTVTSTPSRMLGLENCKGTLEPDADADLVVLEDAIDANGSPKLQVEQVWKFGQCLFDASSHSE